MSSALEALKSELERIGEANDPGWWPKLRRVLRPGGLLVVDNAVSHQEQMTPVTALVKADPLFTTSLVPVGKGEFPAVKAPA